jgi:hypothetical protein
MKQQRLSEQLMIAALAGLTAISWLGAAVLVPVII